MMNEEYHQQHHHDRRVFFGNIPKIGSNYLFGFVVGIVKG
jgi:hypothetical protein